MTIRRQRFWDTTVFAAAITAVVGGMTASLVAFMNSGQAAAQSQIDARVMERKAQCEHAYSILMDDSLNSALPVADRERLVADELAKASDCRRTR